MINSNNQLYLTCLFLLESALFVFATSGLVHYLELNTLLSLNTLVVLMRLYPFFALFMFLTGRDIWIPNVYRYVVTPVVLFVWVFVGYKLYFFGVFTPLKILTTLMPVGLLFVIAQHYLATHFFYNGRAVLEISKKEKADHV